MSPDEGRPETPEPGSSASGTGVTTSITGEQGLAHGAQRTLLYLTMIAAAAVLVILIALVVANRNAVSANWVFGSSSVSMAWVVLGAALLGLLLGLLLAVLLRPARSWWLVVAIVVLVAAVAAWSFLMRQEGGVAPVASPSVSPSLSASPSPPPSLSASPSPPPSLSASPLPSLSASLSPLPSPALSASPSPVAWTGAWGRIDGVGGGLVVAGSSGAYNVTFYDATLRTGASVPATLSADGRQLQFTMPSQFSISGPSIPFEATLTLGETPDTATLRIIDAVQTSVYIPFRRVPE